MTELHASLIKMLAAALVVIDFALSIRAAMHGRWLQLIGSIIFAILVGMLFFNL